MKRYYSLVAALLLVGGAVHSQQQQGTSKTTNDIILQNTTTDFTPSLITDTFDGAGDNDKTRISLSLDDASLKDAVKDICDQSHANYVIEKDVPQDARVTVHAKGLRVSTALDVVTQAANVGWSVETTYKPASKSADKTTTYHITRQSGRSMYWTGNLALTPSLKALTTNGNQFYTVAPNQRTSDLWFTPNGKSLTFNQNKDYSNYLYELVAPEKRSTFTCPHCKGQVTIVRKPHAVKCPKCGREMQPGWQFCPNDGTKRPADPGEWRFCPLCGKPIDVEN
jgi:hypothetical protein